MPHILVIFWAKGDISLYSSDSSKFRDSSDEGAIEHTDPSLSICFPISLILLYARKALRDRNKRSKVKVRGANRM